MGFKCGIVGLPNVGKSTLFNALTETSSAEAANYPFCTIEPNSGVVSVPDKRLNLLSNLAKSQKTIPAQMQFVDIAGLVSGASKGAVSYRVYSIIYMCYVSIFKASNHMYNCINLSYMR